MNLIKLNDVCIFKFRFGKRGERKEAIARENVSPEIYDNKVSNLFMAFFLFSSQKN